MLGGSHDRTDLLPLKVGVSLMALGAMANEPGLRVRIVPVGLSYFHAHRFRSRAVVEFGAPLDVPAEFVEMFRQGGDKKREATGQLLDLIYNSLKTVTVRSPDFETLMVREPLSKKVGRSTNITTAYPSWSSTIQNPWTASYTRTSGRAEQAIHRRISAFPARTSHPATESRRSQVQPKASGSWSKRSPGELNSVLLLYYQS